MIRYASPTFLFRRDCPAQLGPIMKTLGQLGFDGLELFGMFGFSSEDILAFCRDSGLSIVCDHIHYDEFSQDAARVVASRAALGARYLTIDNIPVELLPGNPGFDQARSEISRISRLCRERDIQLLYHNHGYDLIRRVGDVPTLDLILDGTDPEELKFQPDLGWLALGGGDPAYYLEKYRFRCPIIHLKDYYASAPLLLESPFILGERRGGKEHHFFEFRPSGYGVMNFPALMPSILACRPQWITTDHDFSYERDTFRDMKMGLDYVKYLASL